MISCLVLIVNERIGESTISQRSNLMSLSLRMMMQIEHGTLLVQFLEVIFFFAGDRRIHVLGRASYITVNVRG